MNLRTTTLSAVSAVLIGSAGALWAQDATTIEPAPAPEDSQQAPAADGAATDGAAADPAAEAPGTDAAPAEEPEAAEPAAEEPAADAAPADEPAADAAPDEEPAAAEPAATEAPAAGEPATADAPAEGATDEPAADEPAAEEAPSEEPAAEDTPAAEPAAEEQAAEEAPAEDAAPEEPATEGEATADETETATEPAAEGEAGAEEDHASESGGGHGGGHIEDITFSFEGPLGNYDQFQLQRGLQVYTEVCSACHGLRYVPLRTLGDEGGPGLPEDQVRAYAANFTIIDAETQEERPRAPTDPFPTVTGDGMGPDLSLMAKARAAFHGPAGTGVTQLFRGTGGPEYIHGLLTSYTGEEIEQAGTFLYENTAFPSGALSMPPPLSDDLVTYEDGTPATVDQMARDVSAFLMWTAEPKMMARKSVGLVAVLFLAVLAGLLFYTNKAIWAPHKSKR